MPIRKPLLDQGALALLVAVDTVVTRRVLFLLMILPNQTIEPAPARLIEATASTIDAPSPTEPEQLHDLQLGGVTLLLDPTEDTDDPGRRAPHTEYCNGAGSHLCTESMRTIEGTRLDPAVFVHVHHSRIVDTDAVGARLQTRRRSRDPWSSRRSQGFQVPSQPQQHAATSDMLTHTT